MKPEFGVFWFSSFHGTCCTQMPDFLKEMVMGPLCNTFVIKYIYYEQIIPYYPTDNVLWYTIKEKSRIWSIFGFPAFTAHFAPRCLTFEINIHEATVLILLWYNTYIMNKLTSITQLVTYLGPQYKKKLEFGAFLCYSFYGTSCTQMPDFWNKWSYDLCLIPLWLRTYIINKLTRATQLVTHLGPQYKKKLEFGTFLCYSFHGNSCTQMPRLLK